MHFSGLCGRRDFEDADTSREGIWLASLGHRGHIQSQRLGNRKNFARFRLQTADTSLYPGEYRPTQLNGKRSDRAGVRSAKFHWQRIAIISVLFAVQTHAIYRLAVESNGGLGRARLKERNAGPDKEVVQEKARAILVCALFERSLDEPRRYAERRGRFENFRALEPGDLHLWRAAIAEWIGL